MRTLIVGAGSAGAVIASRLSEDPRHDVVLVEAGPDYPGAPCELPSDLADGTRNSTHRHDWGYSYRATRDGLASLSLPLPRGRVVGGSSAVNTCIALRGSPFDYDEWAARGLPEWSWEHCLPAFVRLERDLDLGASGSPWHGADGPMPIRRHTPAELAPWQAAFLEACDELGLPRCPDTNDPTTTGAGPHAMNKIDGRRVSAAEAYLGTSVRSRPNLHVVPNTTVRRVRVRAGRAQALEIERHGRVSEFGGDRVVLSAGAIATPGILLRSGIGPADELARLGVPLVRDVPAVGARLLDHPGVAIFLMPRARGFSRVTDPLIQNVLRFTSTGSECPNDMQIQPGSFVPLPWGELPLVTLAVCLGKTRSVGRLRLTSARAHDAPRIESDLLADPEDRARVAEALRHIAALISTRALAPLARPIFPSLRPFDASGALRAPLSRIAGSGYHPCGTVPMGADDDERAATDGRGRVRGVRDLFVADASLMPTIPSANTNLATLMIGERFGAWLRDG